jgi:hypothetical protein
MVAVMLTGSKAATALVIVVLVLSATSTGCVYRHNPPIPPSNQRLRIIAKSPERYTIRVLSHEYAASADGNVDFKWAASTGCSVYLFNQIPIHRLPPATKQKNISIMLGQSVVRQLSIEEIARLPKGGDGVPELGVRALR